MRKTLSKQERVEAEVERPLLDAINGLGLYAAHMTTTIDGFPDIIVLGNGNRALLIEMKRGPATQTLAGCFQATQWVWQSKVHRHGFTEVYQCRAYEDVFELYKEDDLYHAVMDMKKFSHMKSIKKGTVLEVAQRIRGIMYGEQEELGGECDPINPEPENPVNRKGGRKPYKRRSSGDTGEVHCPVGDAGD